MRWPRAIVSVRSIAGCVGRLGRVAILRIRLRVPAGEANAFGTGQDRMERPGRRHPLPPPNGAVFSRTAPRCPGVPGRLERSGCRSQGHPRRSRCLRQWKTGALCRPTGSARHVLARTDLASSGKIRASAMRRVSGSTRNRMPGAPDPAAAGARWRPRRGGAVEAGEAAAAGVGDAWAAARTTKSRVPSRPAGVSSPSCSWTADRPTPFAAGPGGSASAW